MSIFFENGETDTKSQLCNAEPTDPFSINQEHLGLLLELASMHRVPYPNVGGSKISNAYYEDLKTVGYGRLEWPRITYYNNSFDPRLTFEGLGHLFKNEGEGATMSTEHLAQNVFLALENSNEITDGLFNNNMNMYQSLCKSKVHDLWVDPNRYKLLPEMDGNVSDDGSEDCKRLFNKISSLPVKDLWTHEQDETARITYASERQTDNAEESTEVEPSSKEFRAAGAKEAPPNTTKDKASDIREYTGLQNNPDGTTVCLVSTEQEKRLESEKQEEHERKTEEAVSEVRTDTENEKYGGELPEVTGSMVQWMAGDPELEDKKDPGTCMKDTPKSTCPNQKTCWAKLFDSAEQADCNQPISNQHACGGESREEDTAQTDTNRTETEAHRDGATKTQQIPVTVTRHGAFAVTTASRQRRYSVKDYTPPPVPRTATNYYFAPYQETQKQDDTAAVKIKTFRKEMERLAAKTDASNTNYTAAEPQPSSQYLAPPATCSQTDTTSSQYPSVNTVVANSVLRPGVASFYPGNNKGVTESTRDYVYGEKETIQPPPGFPQTLANGKPTGTTNAMGQSMVQPQTQQHTADTTTETFPSHHVNTIREAAQKIVEVQQALGSSRPVQQPPGMTKMSLQSSQTFMGNCMHQNARRENAFNPHMHGPGPSRLNNEPPRAPNNYHYPCNQQGATNPYHGQTMMNPPPGFNGPAKPPTVRNNNVPASTYATQQPNLQPTLPLQQQMPFRFITGHNFQQQQQTLNSRSTHVQVQPQQVIRQQQLQLQQLQQQQQQQQYQFQQHHQQHTHYQQQHHNQNQHHGPLHPLQPQQNVMTSEVYFGAMPGGQQQTQQGPRANFHLENTNCNSNNAYSQQDGDYSKYRISFRSSRIADDYVRTVSAEDPGVKSKSTMAEEVRIKRMSVSAECIPSLVQSDRDTSRDKHRISKFRSRRTNLVRIYPSKDCC